MRWTLVALLVLAPARLAVGDGQPPGEHERRCPETTAENARLRALVAAQEKKITLLEEKAKLLEAATVKKPKEGIK